MREAEAWAEAHALTPGAHDSFRCCFVAIDVQNMFCIRASSCSSSAGQAPAPSTTPPPLRVPLSHLGTITRVLASLDTHHATALVDALSTYNAIVVAGQAKSHCLAWTIDDLLADESAGGRLAKRTYLLEECTSPVVVPGAVDYTEEADAVTSRRACTSSPRPIPWRPGPAWPTASADS
jgi:nicotinamidase-related amidase